MEWLNGPLVWAIDDWHQPLFLFPRECPRILIWRVESSTMEDWATWCSESSCRMVGYIERDWADAFERGSIFRYELPVQSFQPLHDAGMWVSDVMIDPLGVERIGDLPAALQTQDVELRVVDDLGALRDVWSTTLHASGIRLRNAKGWPST